MKPLAGTGSLARLPGEPLQGGSTIGLDRLSESELALADVSSFFLLQHLLDLR